LQEEPLPRPNAFENDIDPYAPRTVTPLDAVKDAGWAVTASDPPAAAAPPPPPPAGVALPVGGAAHAAKRVRR